MTYLSGEISVKKDQHRLYLPLNNLLILLASIARATNLIQHGTANFQPGEYLTAESNQFNKEIRFPVFGVVEAAMKNRFPDEILPKLVEKAPPRNAIGSSGFSTVIMCAITPIYVNFYEDSKAWLDTNINTDPQK